MPMRSPNQLLGAWREEGKIDEKLVYVDSDATSTCSTNREGDKDDQYALLAAKREIKRLKEAIRSLETCVKNRKPDTSAAWKAEAEQAQNEVKKVKHEIEQIMKELSIAKDALSQQIIAGKEEIEEAVKNERTIWKERLAEFNQNSDDVRHELQQALSRCEEAEMGKTSALFDLTQERSKVHPRGIDHEIHQGVLQELTMTRTRLKQQEALLSESEGRAKAEAQASQAELQKNSAYLKRVLKEIKEELSEATEQAAESDAKFTRLNADHRRILAQNDALQAENTKLSGAQEKWQKWFQEMEESLKVDGKKKHALGDELVAIRQKLKNLEEMADQSAASHLSKTLAIIGKAPKLSL